MKRPRQQLELDLPTWGGRRAGAGRKRTRERPALPHRAREDFRPYQPVHVSLRMADHVWNLRSGRAFAVVGAAIRACRARRDFRAVDFSVQGNHVHLIVEADGPAALARGVRALAIRLARGLNAMMGRHGPVFADRYHAHVLRTPAEVRNARRYALGNYASHARRRGEHVPEAWVDPYSSAGATRPARGQQALWPEPIVEEGRTWLLRAPRVLAPKTGG